MKKTNYLIKQVIAFLKGDDNEQRALSIQKKVNTAIELEIAVLKADLLTYISKVETLQEEYDKALINNGVDTNFDCKVYISNLTSAYNRLTDAKKNETTCLKKLEFFTENLTLVNKEE